MLKKFLWVFVETISTLLFQFLSVVLLARLLDARDFGILGMMTIFISMSNMIVDSGMGSAIVKKENATAVDFSTLFIYNLFVSLALYFFLFISSGAIARFYNTPELNYLIRLLGLVIIISAFGVVQNAKLIKDLKFKKLTIVAFISNLLSLIIAIIFALNGFGVKALIYQQLSLITIRTIMLTGMNKFVPTFTFSKESFKYQFNFGINILFSNLLQTLYTNIASSIIPKITSVTQNGYYVQANRLQNLPLSIITMVSDKAMFPILAKFNDKVVLIENARKIIRYVLLISFPIIAFCSALSKPIVLLLLGEKWIYASIYLEFLFFAGFGTCVEYLGKIIFKSNGDTKKIFHLQIIQTVTGITMLFISMNFGVMFLMYGIIAASVVLASITMVYLNKHMQYSLKDQLSDLKEPLILTLFSYFILKLLFHYFLTNTVWDITFIIPGILTYLIAGLVIKNKEINIGLILIKNYFIKRNSY